jgi:hypothetical protein
LNLCSFALLSWVLGRMPKFNYVNILSFNFKNSVVLKLIGKMLCVNALHQNVS